MRNDNTTATLENGTKSVLREFVDIFEQHRSGFGQERTYRRALLLAIGMICAFGSHTLTQAIAAIGADKLDWTAWYRLFARKRVDMAVLSGMLLEQTLKHVAKDDVYAIGSDVTSITRSSKTMPLTNWAVAKCTAPFRRGLVRAQRFVTCVWFAPIDHGYTRAFPLRFLPAPSAKSVPCATPVRNEWQTALQYIQWVRAQLDGVGRSLQTVLFIGDGAYDSNKFLGGLPDAVVALVRTAKNRRLREMPGAYSGRGRRCVYGPRVDTPNTINASAEGRRKYSFELRGRWLTVTFKLVGPYLLQGLPGKPFYLLVLTGAKWYVKGKRGKTSERRRDPAFFLVNAVQKNGLWQPPLPVETLIQWAFQRWEMEVAHREMKASFGVGDTQAWGFHSSVLVVEWMAWLYSVMLLAGFRTYGLFGLSRRSHAWSHLARRWSFNALWSEFRSQIWRIPEFRALYSNSTTNPTEMGSRFNLFASAVLFSRRA